MRQVLVNPNGVRPELIEFEAKIGTINETAKLKDALTSDLLKNLFENEAWLIMPEAKGAYQSFYNFNATMPSRPTVSESEIFERML